LIFANKSTCNWKNINQYEKLLISQSEKLINSGLKTHVTPFTAIFLKLSNIQQQQIFKSYASHNSKPQNPLWHKQITSNKNKLRIGYVSSAYRDHATSHLIHALFQYHDYNQVEVYCYAGTKPDLNVSAVQSIQHYSDYFFDLSELSDSDAAIKISNDQIQILIDLDGYTTSNRHGIFKWRPAPIQVNFLGFPGSMGANWNQYIIGDNTVTPAEWDTTCTESPVRMPNCYQLNSHKYLTVDPTPTRDSLSLPDDAIIYCCFNIARKIESTVFNCWMEILKSVPKAMLWILVDDKITKDNILREAAKRGIDKTRLAFAKRVPSAENLARQKIADVFLDTFFCTAHTTASDALWAGLPVITMRGDTFANRVAASIVSAAGLAECITSTPEQYTALAITLGNNPNQLAKLKHKLEHNREQCALFDTPLYVKHLEQAFQQMWINHQANQVKPIDVKP
jgi:predicted O-linked N-acetylglucosamine transferase (SPINDLY family)